MVRKLLRRLRQRVPFGIAGRGEEAEIHAADPARDQRLLADGADTDGDVNAFLHQVDLPVVEPRLQRHLRIGREESGYPAHDHTGEEGGGA